MASHSQSQQVMSPVVEGDKIIKLVGSENYNLWKFQIKILLKSNGVFEIATGVTKEPIKNEGEADQTFDARMKQWVKNDLLAQRILSLSITERPLVFIVNCERSYDMWVKLENVFDNKSEMNVHLLQQKFYNVKIESGESLAIFISRVENLSHQLSVLGSPIPDKMLITKILMSLPEKLKYFLCAWESTAVDDRTLSNLTSRLISEELRLEVEEPPVALVSKNQKKSDDKKGHCFICKKPGHFKKNCWFNKNKQSLKDKNSKKQSGQNSKDSEAMTATSFGFCDKNDFDWFLDSGASDHMTNDLSLFSSYSEFLTASEVKIGNGSFIKALGKGQINLLSYVGDTVVKCHLVDVLYVPEISMNLISLGSVLDRGFEFNSDKEECVLKKNGKVYAIGFRCRKLFKLMITVNKSENINCNIAEKKTFDLWHARLGHQNKNYVIKALNVFGKDVPDSKDFFCEGCKLGKQTRLPFGESTRVTTKIGEVIHSDVCGPMQTDSVGGSRYFVIFKDDFSKFRVINTIRHKSEVFQHFKNFCLKLKKETGNEVCTLRTDQGTEYKNLIFDEFLLKNGIKHELSVVYTPEQNGSSEKENRTIVETARTMIHSKSLNINLWAEAVNTAVYIVNRSYIHGVTKMTPYEMWFNKKPTIDYFRVFGTVVFCHIPKQRRQKWDVKSHKGLLVGYSEFSKGYRIYFPDTNKVEICRDVDFSNEMEKTANSTKNNELEETVINLEINSDNENDNVDDNSNEIVNPDQEMNNRIGTDDESNEYEVLKNLNMFQEEILVIYIGLSICFEVSIRVVLQSAMNLRHIRRLLIRKIQQVG